MVSRNRFVALALPLLPGCGGIGDTYSVQVDPHFSVDEQAAIVAALESWEAAVPVHFEAQVASCSGVHSQMICTHASDRAEIAARESSSDGIGLGLTIRERSFGATVDGGEIFLDVPTIEADYAVDFQRIAGHEIGHAMQLEHNAPGNLMAAMATDDAPAPTCVDDAQWYGLRGRSAPRCAP